MDFLFFKKQKSTLKKLLQKTTKYIKITHIKGDGKNGKN